MATRIYLKEVARCAKSKFKPLGENGSQASSNAHLVLEIDPRTGKIGVVKNRYGKCGELV